MTTSEKYPKAHKSRFREYSEKFPVIAQREISEAIDQISVLVMTYHNCLWYFRTKLEIL